jgi:hypothetical protein
VRVRKGCVVRVSTEPARSGGHQQPQVRSRHGIQLLGPSTGLETSVSHNVALRNGGWGIAAVPGTHDGGGNRAAGNGNPAQCLNIVCT